MNKKTGYAQSSLTLTTTNAGTLTRAKANTKAKHAYINSARKKSFPKNITGLWGNNGEAGASTKIGAPPKPNAEEIGETSNPLVTNRRKLLNEADCLHIDTKSGRFEIRKNANGWWVSQNVEHTKVINFMGTIRICPKVIQACLCAGLTPKQWVYFLKYHPKFCVHLENSDFKVQKDVGDGRVQEIVKSILEKYESAQKNLRREIKSEHCALLKKT